MGDDVPYRTALENCELALPDSGFMVLSWFLRTGQWLPRLSGLRFLRHLLEDPAFRAEKRRFWVMPNDRECAANIEWLNARGIETDEADTYVAPVYDSADLIDERLVSILKERRPRYIVINIGGGVQEILGYNLRATLEHNPVIACTGAAVAFLSGHQAAIPVWADRLFLGWLIRIASSPGSYFQRYWQAFGLLPLIFRFRENPVRGK